MTTMTETLKTSAITANGCTLAIVGTRYVMTGPTGKHSLDVDSTCERRLAAHWLGFAGPVVEAPAKKARVLRTYAVTIAYTDFVAGMSMEPCHAGNVSGCDRNEAMRKARDLGRDLVGPHGPGYKLSVRLAN